MAVFREVLRRLALLAAGISTAGIVAITADLVMIPERTIESVLEDSSSDEQWRPDDRLRLLQLLALDPRASVRELVAEFTGDRTDVSLEDLAPLLDRLAHDPREEVLAALADGLATLLPKLPPLERLQLISEWSSSPDESKRLLIANVIVGRKMALTLGEATAIDHLLHDKSPSVREATLAALALRLRKSPLT